MQTPDPTPHRTSIPTLARLSFWIPPERMSEFEAAYEARVVPILERHALTPSSERGRATPKGVFSRLFEVESPSAVVEIRKALQRDLAWTEALQDLGRVFGTAGPEGLAQYGFDLYAAPAGPGRAVSAGRGRGHWRTYDTTDGLPDIMIRSIFQDREGYLWFGSYGGVSRFDGETFATFTTQDGLADNVVLSILQDREGYLWFTTSGGVSRCDPSTLRQARRSEGAGQRFVTFTTREGLAHHDVLSALQDRNGYLWFCTVGGGVSRYDPSTSSELALSETKGQGGERFATFTTRDGLAHDDVLSALQDREGNLWFGTYGGVSRYDGERFVTFTTRDGLAHNEVLSALQDREENLWFGTRVGVSRFDGRTFTTFTTEDGLADNQVRAIFQDREGVLWFGTYGGVNQYDPSASLRAGGRAFITFTTEDGLAHNKVYSILEDREGYLWFGTYGGGASRYDGKTFVTFTTRDGLAHNEVVSIFQGGDGCLWFCAGQIGVSRYDGRTFTTFTTQDGLAHDEMHSIFQDREGCLWFGDEHGSVSRYDGRTFTVIIPQYGMIHNRVWSIFQDQEGHLWFGTRYGGTIRYNPSTSSELALPVLSTVEGSATREQGSEAFTPFTIREGLADNEVYSIFQDQEGYLWFGTRHGGACRYDGRTFMAFTREHGLANNWVRSIFEDREGRLWFSTNEGVSRYDPQGSETEGQCFVTFTKEDGLANNRVWSILQSREGHLWFSTSGGGVSRYDGQVFQTITRQDGLAHDGVRSIFEDQKGNLWFGTNGGATRYCPPAPAPPPVFIDAVVADRRYERESDLSTPFRAGLVVFEFRGMSFKTQPGAMVYRYRLKGYDKDWRTTRERKVEYQDLPVGDYTFEVLAVDRDLGYSEQPATVKVTVTPDPRIEALTEALSGGRKAGEFVGKSDALRRIQAQLSEVAWTDVTVLILGETGTGKGLAARAVHALSARREGPFIQVNCGAIPEGLVESELFGHEKGAFTGAASRKLGKVEVAEGGTLFLDEIGDMPLGAQVKLLRLLEERTFERVGGTQTLKAETRVIAATNRDLKRMMSEGKFREDLYFRLQAFPTRLPPLRERREDIPQLAEYFIRRMAAHLNKQVTHLTSEALALLNAYDWPGNVRELEHAVQRAVIVCRGPAIQVRDIVLETEREDKDSSEEVVTLEEVERQHIQKVLERMGWVIRGPHGAAALLGLNEATLRFRMKKMGIRRSEQ